MLLKMNNELPISFCYAGNREVLDLIVKCENSGAGCGWLGELRALEEHKPACQCILTRCPLSCDTLLYGLKGCVPKKNLESHLGEECQERNYECPHCGEGGKYSERTGPHLEDCLYAPMPCPNGGCDKEVSSFLVTIHMATECDFEVVDCKYKADGCDVRLVRKDLEEHEKDDKFHFQIAMRAIRELREGLRSVKTTLVVPSQEDGNEQLKGSAELSSKLLHDEVKQLRAFNRTLVDDIKELRKKAQQTSAKVTQNIFPTITFKIPDFFTYRIAGERFVSIPFYTSQQGYKLCVCVYPNESNYVKVQVHLMKGEYDGNLDWPFSGKIRVELLNQKADSNHHMKVTEYPTEGGQRVLGAVERSAKGYTALIDLFT
jgi:TNF receptor-associated factor 4